MKAEIEAGPQVAASPQEGEDALSLLTADHREVAALFEEYADLVDSDADLAERARTVDEICLQLTVHSHLEQELFYPAVRQAIGEAELVEEAEAEHRGIEEAIDDLRAMDPSDEGYDDRVDVLRETVEQHVAEEEGSMFPMVLDSPLDLDRLGEQMTARREEMLLQVREELSDDLE